MEKRAKRARITSSLALLGASALASWLSVWLSPYGWIVPGAIIMLILATESPMVFFWLALAGTAFLKTIRLPVLGPRLTASELLMAAFLFGAVARGHALHWCWDRLRGLFVPGILVGSLAAIALVQITLGRPEARSTQITESAILLYDIFFAALLVVIPRNREALGKIARFIAFLAIPVSGLAVAGFFLGLDFFGTSRITGTFRDPNQLAAYELMLVPLAALLLRGKWRYTALGLSLAAVLLTASRSGIIGLVAGAAGAGSLVVFSGRVKLSYLRVGLALLVLGGLVGLTLYHFKPDAVMFALHRIEEFKEIGASGAQAHSVEARQILWRAGVMAWRENPLWGMGYGAFVSLVENWAPYGFSEVHNTPIRLLAETGVVGFLLATGFMIYILAGLARIYRRRGSLLSLALIWALSSHLFFGLGVEIMRMRNLWMILGLGLCLISTEGSHEDP